MLARVMATAGRKAHIPHPPRSKSTSSKPSQPQVRTLKTTSSPAPIPKVKSDVGLANGVRNLSIQERKKNLPPRPTKTAVAGSVRRTGSVTTSSAICNNLEDVSRYIREGRAKNIVVMAGAGISTPSGIPDFRSPGTGLYDNLQQYNIPYPEAIFDIDYFHMNPRPFFALSKELYPSGKYRPNYIHYFMRLLHDKGLLHRMYTQNIDGLERLAGIPSEKLVEAHGTFSTATCIRCNLEHRGDEIKDAIFSDKLPKCKKTNCLGIVKPDIVFFGEELPRRFYYYLKDFPQADLVLVLGTSLEVEPFASIVDASRSYIPRVLFNREAVGPFKRKRRNNDVVSEGDLIANVQKFVRILEWQKDMEYLMKENEKLLDEQVSAGTLSSSGSTPSGGNKGDGKDGSACQNGNSGNLTGITRPTNRNMHTFSRNGPSYGFINRKGASSTHSLPPISKMQNYRSPRTISSSSSSEEESESDTSSDDSDA
ncbi:NAD-dependent protein deacetylase sirtuin-3 [Lingula anatina]|uniref:NAD-dependent protein deacetylase sirtuin-3 n=1 Tax=Lingula anatina TaxID=7574 RepID=A0A1S3JTY3_LINAN|nr:NAD-dependent protein deacetylase sirtuin-3 [Lingula anatina]|eukprot:XP_013413830.1 NAD-dependent protein deacetylase sirtuin-3 [Lingula anatina]